MRNPKAGERSLFQSDGFEHGAWVSEPIDPDPWTHAEKRTQRSGASAKGESVLTAIRACEVRQKSED